MLIDDFSDSEGISALGTRWQGFTDRVMGGLSDIQAGYASQDEQTVLVMRGQVRLENNGGFVQVRLPLEANGGNFDASQFDAIRIRGRAVNSGSYYLHLRTADTRRPWSYYRAALEFGQEWTTLELPLATFQPRSLDAPLDVTHLRSLAVVAYGEAFEAHVQISRIEWVRQGEGESDG